MKIVVRGTNWIGDSVMSIPAIRALRRLFPDSHITLHSREWAEGIFRDADFIDRILVYKRSESGLNDVFEQSRRLRSEQFDLAVILPNSFASALTARAAGIPRRFGFSREARALFLTDPVKPPSWKGKRHEVYYYLRLVEEVERRLLGSTTLSDWDHSTDLNVSLARLNDARNFLAQKGFDLDRPTVAIGAGSANSRAKRWPPENYAAIIRRLQNDLKAQIVLLGESSERSTSATITGSALDPPLDLVGKTSLADAVAILGVADLLISNDMGLAHVAPAVGTPTLVIFGPTDPLTTRPFSRLAKIIRKDVECSPCMLRDCPIDHRCMAWISTDEVFDQANAILQEYERNNVTPAGSFHRP